MADSVMLDADRSRLYKSIIEQKRRQLAGSTVHKTQATSPLKPGLTLASTVDGGNRQQAKLGHWEEEISEISKATEKKGQHIDKTPDPSLFRKSFNIGQSNKNDESQSDDEVPRLPSFSLTPSARPKETLHDTISKLVRGEADAKSELRAKPGLPQTKSLGGLKQLDVAQLKKARQKPENKSRQIKVSKVDHMSRAATPSRAHMRDKLSNRLSFLVKTFADKEDKNSVSFAGLGKVLSALGVFKQLTVADMDINEMLIDRIKMQPRSVRAEIALHQELWNFLSYYCLEGTQLCPAKLLKAMLHVMLTRSPDQEGIKMLRTAIDTYLCEIGWNQEQIDEFNYYVEADIEDNKRLQLFKIFLKLDELRRQPDPEKSCPKITFESDKDQKTQYNSSKEKLKKRYNISGSSLDRTSLLFEGFEFVFMPDTRKSATSMDNIRDYEDIIKKRSFAELMNEAREDMMKTAYDEPMKRAVAHEKTMRELEEQEKENFNVNLVGDVSISMKEA